MSWIELTWLGDAELLRRLGRGALAGLLAMLAPLLTLPDPNEPDDRYFALLAAALRRLPLKVIAYLPPIFEQGYPVPAPTSASAGAAEPQHTRQRPYALRREGELWHLTFDGRPAVIKHEQGLYYIAETFRHPGERIKQLKLVAKYSARRSKAHNGVEVYDPATGQYVTPNAAEPVHQISLARDDQETRQVYRARARELKDILDDPTETEAAKAQAREELEDLIAHLGKDSRVARDPAKAAGDAVRCAIKKLLRNLSTPSASTASPGSVRQALARHIEQYLLIPSRRYAAPGARAARGDLTGCLLYEPPAGVHWAISL
jgi:hypothetical protein